MGAQVLPEASYGPPPRIEVEDFVHHLATLEAELARTGSIVLTRGEQTIAEVRLCEELPQPPRRPFSERMPDFAAQLKEMYGDKVFPDSTLLIRADRNGE